MRVCSSSQNLRLLGARRPARPHRPTAWSRWVSFLYSSIHSCSLVMDGRAVLTVLALRQSFFLFPSQRSALIVRLLHSVPAAFPSLLFLSFLITSSPVRDSPSFPMTCPRSAPSPSPLVPPCLGYPSSPSRCYALYPLLLVLHLVLICTFGSRAEAASPCVSIPPSSFLVFSFAQ